MNNETIEVAKFSHSEPNFTHQSVQSQQKKQCKTKTFANKSKFSLLETSKNRSKTIDEICPKYITRQDREPKKIKNLVELIEI